MQDINALRGMEPTGDSQDLQNLTLPELPSHHYETSRGPSIPVYQLESILNGKAIELHDYDYPSPETILTCACTVFNLKQDDYEVRHRPYQEDRACVYFIHQKGKEKVCYVFKVYPFCRTQEIFDNMYAVSKGPMVKAFRDFPQQPRKNYERFLPNIILPICFFTYETPLGLRHIEVMQGSPGLVLWDVIFGDNISGVTKNESSFRAGCALGALHRKFVAYGTCANDIGAWRVFPFGDYHYCNIFWEFSCQNIILIDPETLAIALDEPQKIDWDIVAYVLIPFLSWHYDLGDQHQSFIASCECFLLGYVSTFPRRLRQALLVYLKGIILQRLEEAHDIILWAMDWVDAIVQEDLVKASDKAIEERFKDRSEQLVGESYRLRELGMWEFFLQYLFTLYKNKDEVVKKNNADVLCAKFSEMYRAIESL